MRSVTAEAGAAQAARASGAPNELDLSIEPAPRRMEAEPLVKRQGIAGFLVHRRQGNALQADEARIVACEVNRLGSITASLLRPVDHDTPDEKTIALKVFAVLRVLDQPGIDQGYQLDRSSAGEQPEAQGLFEKRDLGDPLGIRGDQVSFRVADLQCLKVVDGDAAKPQKSQGSVLHERSLSISVPPGARGSGRSRPIFEPAGKLPGSRARSIGTAVVSGGYLRQPGDCEKQSRARGIVGAGRLL